MNRRTFIQLSVLSSAVATSLTGCKNEAIWQEEAAGQYGGMSNKVYPYVNQPDGYQDGVPQYFATTCQMCAAGCGIYVRSLSGRANKVEGNPYHPVNAGKTCLRGQLALQHLYNPDRLMFPSICTGLRGSFDRATWDEALAKLSSALAGSKGKTAILVDGVTIGRSPSKMALLQHLSSALSASLVRFSPVDDSPWRAAALLVYGRDQIPDYQLDIADVIVSFGGNFLETWPSPVRYSRLFGEFRQGTRRDAGDHGRFIYVGPRLSMTAAKADQWIPCAAGTEAVVAQGILGVFGVGRMTPTEAASISGVDVGLIEQLARSLKAAGTRSLSVGGDGLYTSSSVTQNFVAVERLNSYFKSLCVGFGSTPMKVPDAGVSAPSITSLITDMAAGNIAALVYVGSVNPLFSLPQSAGWADAVAKVPFVASIGSFLDESSTSADVALAARTFLEEWGDFIPNVLPGSTATSCLTQPVIDPSFITKRHEVDADGRPVQMMDTREYNDILVDLIGRLSLSPSKSSIDIVRQTWASLGLADLKQMEPGNDPKWVETVSNGGHWSSTTEKASPRAAGNDVLILAPVDRRQFSLQVYPHIYFDDGRNANLDWAQEMPDPMAASVWNCWVEINAQTAHNLGVRTGDIVSLSSSNGSFELPALPTPAIHPNVVAIPLGQGHSNYGRTASGIGINPLDIVDYVTDRVTNAFAFSATTVSIVKVRDAIDGYHPEQKTLVLIQDRPGGREPAEVKNLIHETANEWRTGKTPKPPVSRSKPVI